MKLITLITLMIAGLGQTFAQSLNDITNIGINQTLSNNFVMDMTADGDGFVWVVTENGLNRITGYQHFPLNMNNSLFGVGSLWCVCYDPTTKKVWIGSYKGLATYDCKTQTFNKVDNGDKYRGKSVTDIQISSDGGLWITLRFGQVQYYDSKKATFTTYDFTRSTKDGTVLNTAIDDGNNHLLVGSTNGLICYSLNTHQKRLFRNRPDDNSSLPNNQIRKLFVDHLHNIWVGTKGGLGLFYPQSGQFQQLLHNGADVNSLCGDNIFDITEMKDNKLWIAADLGGISTLDLDLLESKRYKAFCFNNLNTSNSSLSSSNVRSIVQDKFGNIWIGNYGTGVDFINPMPRIFNLLTYTDTRKCAYSIDIDSKNNLWIGGESNVTQVANGRIVRNWNISKCQSEVYAVKADSQGMIWIGLNDVGVMVLTPQTGQMQKLAVIGNNDTHDFTENANGAMLIASDAGIFSVKDGKVIEEKRINSALSTRSVYSLVFDRQGRLWVATMGGGIYIFGRNRRLLGKLSDSNGLPCNNVCQLLKDQDGGIWAATYKGLVYIPDTEKPYRILKYGISQGLKDEHLRALVQDRMGNIWVSSFTDLSCFNVNKGRFYNYRSFVPQGSFFQGGAVASSDGYLYFCSQQGVYYFNPSLIRYDEAVSSVKIVAFQQLVGSDYEDAKHYVPNMDNIVTLNYDENNFMIASSVSNYAQVNNVDYQYMMEGLKDEWFDSPNGIVSFRGLSPGNYIFRIRAKLRSQDWNNATETEIKIHLLPPFWLSWWAKVIYFTAIIVAFYLYFYSYKRRLYMQNQLELERRDNLHREELNEERMRFFTNITHELRTPLTLIIGPLEDLANDNGLLQEYRKKIDLIRNAATRLLNLVNGLLEFRKTETHNRQLVVSKGDITHTIKEVALRFKELNRNTDVKFIVNIGQDIPEIYFDREAIASILTNLLSNAVKYTTKGCIKTDIAKQGDEVVISVSDTGSGIDEKDLPHIFDRYYQADGACQDSGTGIGLAFVKSLADLHHAELSVKSKVGVGSSFIIALDANENYPEALHKEHKSQEQVKPFKNETSMTAQKPLLLVVEDNNDIRQYISDSLNDKFNVLQATNGKEGVEIAQQKIPDIIVSDIMMPFTDGIELTRVLKNDIATSHIPIILLTAKDTISDKEEGYCSGADSYLTKPFSAKLLHIRIDNLLENRRRIQYQLSRIQIDVRPEQELPKLNTLDRKFMDKLDKTIDKYIMSDALTIDFLTDIMAMSRATFYRKMKALTGLSAMEYIRKRRLQHAAFLLKSGEHNVTEAAMLSGFNNMGYFRESFRHEFGMLPSEYGNSYHS